MDHFELLGVLLAGPKRKTGSVQVYDGFADEPTGHSVEGLGKLVPAEGARLPTGKVGSVLQIGLKVVKPGIAIRTGIRIYYSVGDAKFVSYQPGGIVNCPQGTSDDACFEELYAVW